MTAGEPAAPAVFDDVPLDERWTADAAPQPGRVALLVAHGMGQQVRFETIDTVARLVAQAFDVEDQAAIAVRLVRLPGETTLGRAELRLPAAGQLLHVHVYETYWAPLAEGAATLRDVASFLLRSGLAGLSRSRILRFDRFLFNAWREYVVPLRAVLEFALALAGFGALTALNLAIIAGAASTAAFGRSVWPDADLVAAWTVDFGIFAVPTAATGLALWLLSRRERGRRRRGWSARRRHEAMTAVAAGFVALAIGALLIAGALVLIHLAGRARAPFAAVGTRLTPGWIAAVWAGALATSAAIRWFLIEFVGDVAAYVSAPWLDRFNRLRDDIKRVAYEAGRAVYANRTYERVIVLGHSLGSVVAYDMLNRLINDDLIAESSAGVEGRSAAARTRTFITFGSPLDKTAFVFRTQGGEGHAVREALAAAVQPLIVSDAWRPERWLNLWSPRDWISGSLEYYDPPGGAQQVDRPDLDGTLEAIAAAPPRRVCNIVDRDAAVPLLAHVQYWTNPLLARCLADAIRRA
jgi:hypothetical protein